MREVKDLVPLGLLARVGKVGLLLLLLAKTGWEATAWATGGHGVEHGCERVVPSSSSSRYVTKGRRGKTTSSWTATGLHGLEHRCERVGACSSCAGREEVVEASSWAERG